ncbi:tetratricopeptide repeat protein [Algoriphagus litoralis]|uniref:tetratricopeptide repeat protein n=1 Tax=Algoriphagus litoralis TaxID=2202829 RepID=UPI000DBAD655|nr:tetratricopeptide repeat protein [Algoriphagus litoralis]
MLKNSLLLVLLLSLLTQPVFCQKLDSLLKVYKSNPKGEDRYSVLQALFDSYVFNDLSEAKKYGFEHLELAEKEGETMQIARATYNIGVLVNNTNDYDSAAVWYRKALVMFQELEALERVAKVNFALAILDYYKGDYPSALALLDQNISMLLEIKPDSLLLGGDFQLKGQIEVRRGNLNIALKETLRAVKIFQNTGDELRLADAYNLLGSLETSLKNFQKSIEYNLLALKIYKKYEDRFFQAQALNDIGNNYFYLNDFPQAIQYLQESIALSEALGSKDLQGTAYTNWGKTLNAQENYQEAIPLLLKGLSLAEETGNAIKVVEAYNDLSQSYIGLKQSTQAILYLDRAIVLAKEQGAKETLSTGYFFRSQAKELMGDPSGALEDFRAFAALKDSLLDETKSRLIEEQRTLFDLEKKENEILLLEQKAEISQLQMTLLASGVIALTLLLGIGFYAYRQKLKKNQLERLRMDEQLQFKSRALTAQALHLAKKNETLENLKQTALQLKDESDATSGYQKLIRTINSDLSDDRGWATFSKYFEEVHPEFFSKASKNFPGLSPAEYRLMALIRMNLSSKEMANILMISMPGIKKARQRLRKKLGLETGDSLEEVILSL